MKLFYTINKPSGDVFNYLTDMQRFVSVHPVITKMIAINDDSYCVYETLQFGGIPVSFTYQVTIESWPAEGVVIMRATVNKTTSIEMRFTVKKNENCTMVEEEIIVESLLPVKLMLHRIFKKQHRQLFRNIQLAA